WAGGGGGSRPGVAVQAGVGSPSTPAAKNIIIFTVPPETVPVNVPLLLRWQDPHDPSAGSTACVFTVPTTESPDCVSANVTRVAPCESIPMPAHVPVKAATVVGGGGTVVAGGRAIDAGALGVDELHAMPSPTSAIV